MTTDSEAGARLLFGVYAGSAVGDATGGIAVGPPDDPARTAETLDRLQGRPGRPFLVRAYTPFDDTTPLGTAHPTATPADAAQYAVRGRRLDLVAQYHSRAADIDGFGVFVRDLVEQYGAVTDTLQVAEEPNITTNPLLDGHYSGVQEAIIHGVAAARDHARALGHHHLRIGFNTTPVLGPTATFIADLTARGGPDFVANLDYIGLDFFPDVFRPIAPANLASSVGALLRHHRDTVLTTAGLAHLPLHITEHGWPTTPDRPAHRQAEVLDTVVRTIAAHAGRRTISAYVHFSLRDADSTAPGLFHGFGLTTDDYHPKPAFDTMRQLIEEFSV